MSELIKTVAATLSVEMYVECPNEECDNYIDLLDENQTDGVAHNDDGYLLRQMFPRSGNCQLRYYTTREKIDG